jgi:hypothetical protein
MPRNNQHIACALVLLLVAVLSAGGCAPKHANRSDSPLVTSYKLIDDKREDEAIFLLNQEIAKNPGDTPYAISLKVAMASAYAHKAGFKVQKFAALLNVSKKGVEFSIKPAVHTSGTSSKEEAVDDMIHAVGTLLASFNVIMDYYTAIPTVKPEDERYLDYAIRILDDIGDKLTPGQSLYRAVLKVVYLKNYLAAHVFADETQINLNLSSCNIDFKKLDKSLSKTAKVSIAILDDITKAQPSKAESFAKLRKQLAASSSDLTLVVTSASLLDETSKDFTKRAIVQAGLRNLLQCRAPGVPALVTP